MKLRLCFLLAILLPAGWSMAYASAEMNKADNQVDAQWCTQSQLINGKCLFYSSCTLCYGLKGQGFTGTSFYLRKIVVSSGEKLHACH